MLIADFCKVLPERDELRQEQVSLAAERAGLCLQPAISVVLEAYAMSLHAPGGKHTAFHTRTEAYLTRAEAVALPGAGIIGFPVHSSGSLQDKGGKPAGKKG